MNREEQAVAIFELFKAQPESIFTEKSVTDAMKVIYGDEHEWHISDILQEYVKTGVLAQAEDKSFRYLFFENRQIG